LYFVNDSLYLVRNGATETIDYADPIQRWIPLEYTLVMKEEPLNVRVIYGEGKLQVFYKLQSEGEEAFAQPRAVFENLPEDITGHIQITTSGNDAIQGWFTIDNVKISSDIHADLSAAAPASAEDNATDAGAPAETPAAEAGDAPAAGEAVVQQPAPAADAPAAADNPKTGDDVALGWYAVLAIVSLAVVVLFTVRTRRQQG